MGYRHSRDELLDAAVQVVQDSGLGGLTFGAVSRQLGIPDRTVVYYFPSKDDLVAAVLGRTTEALQQLLAPALGPEPAAESELLRRSWAALSGSAAQAAVRLHLECVGLAAGGREPYRTVADQLVATWTGWLADRLTGDEATRADRAAALVATLDGLLLLRAVAGQPTADSAARGLGLRA